MKKLFSFVLGLLLFLCLIAVQAEAFEPMPQEEIVEAPSEDALNYLLNEASVLRHQPKTNIKGTFLIKMFG